MRMQPATIIILMICSVIVLFGGVGWFIVKPIQQLQHQTSLTKFKVSDFQLVSQKQQSSGTPRRDLFD
ncbi:MAG: hypothetical protein OEY38_15940, partial [Gammaproteobacteria bacterium]|nr:hypothetical protein [Gammaproteobacteria bacterium]